jgi:hypothetical protein
MNFCRRISIRYRLLSLKEREYMPYTIVEVMICMHLWLYLLEKKRNLSMSEKPCPLAPGSVDMVSILHRVLFSSIA